MSFVLCPVTSQTCQRSCIANHLCELDKMKRDPKLEPRKEERRKEFTKGRSYFIESQHLGAIEGSINRMLRNGLKKSRRVEFNHIQQVLKTLELIPQAEKVVSLALGQLDNGETGLVVLCSSPHHVQGDVPTTGGNYAAERKEARNEVDR